MPKTILWLCNLPFSREPLKGTGSWLDPMGQALITTGQIILASISQARVPSPSRCDCGKIAQWVVPFEPLNTDGLPSTKTIDAIQHAVEEIKPDLIHVWGTENYWGLLTARKFLSGPAILEMQGIKYACAKVFYGGLTLAERLHCIGPLEIARPSRFLMFNRLEFERWGKFEREMLLKHTFVSTQSDWVRSHVQSINPNCNIIKTNITLRNEFIVSRKWTPFESHNPLAPRIFAISSGATAYKGLHIIIRAISLLKKKFPQITLNIAGDQIQNGVRQSGYSRWLQREVSKLGLEKHVNWLGLLNANEIIQQLHNSSAIVVPSFVESYCVALVEAMIVGVPAVVSFAGALPELARHEESALYFPPGDENMCAWQLDRLLSNRVLACHISENAIKISQKRTNFANNVKSQLKIYNDILS